MTFNGSTLTATGISATTGTITNLVPGGLTSGRVTYYNGVKIVDDADFSFNGTTVTATGVATTSMTVSGASSLGPISATTGDFSGALSATTLNTGQGANELFDMDQHVQTTDSPTFGGLTLTYGVGAATGAFSGALSGATLNTGNGANELYPMDQAVRTTDTPTFSGVSLTYGISAATGTFSSTTTINSLRVQGRPFLDPTAPPYNAVGDGVTDDDAAIEAALAALETNGVMILPSGYTFKTNSGILFQKSSTTILGLGGKILGGVKNIKILDTNNFDDITITGVVVEGTGKDDGHTSSGRGGIHISTNSERCVVDRNRIYYANGSGIVEDGEGYSKITNNLIYETGEHGIYMSSSLGATVENNTIIYAGKNSALTSPSCYAIKIDGAENSTVGGNIIKDPLTLGIQFADDAKHNTVTHNTIQMPSTAQNAIVGSGGSSSFNTISVNTIIQANDSAAIELTSNSSTYLVEANEIFISSGAIGILLGGPSHSVKNNRIFSSVASPYGIYSSGNANFMEHNDIAGTGSGSFTVGISLVGNNCRSVNNTITAGTKYSSSGTGNFIMDSASGPGLDIGNSGRLMSLFLGENTTWDPANLTNGSSTFVNVTVTGAVVGDFAYATLDTLTAGSMYLNAAVTGTNQVSVSLHNHSGGDVNVANGNLKVRTIRW